MWLKIIADFLTLSNMESLGINYVERLIKFSIYYGLLMNLLSEFGESYNGQVFFHVTIGNLKIFLNVVWQSITCSAISILERITELLT